MQWHNHGVISNPLPPLPCVKMHSTAEFKSVALEEVISVTIAGQMMTMSGWLSMNLRVPHNSLDYKNYAKENMFLGRPSGPIKMHFSKKVSIKYSIMQLHS